jgi:hypothetical protein
VAPRAWSLRRLLDPGSRRDSVLYRLTSTIIADERAAWS